VVSGNDRELPRLGPRAEQVGRALELAGLGGEREITRDDEVLDRRLPQALEEALQEPDRVFLAVLRGEAVPGVTAPIREVEVADVTEADDDGLRAWTRSVRGWVGL
jgi:hypothetical protein